MFVKNASSKLVCFFDSGIGGLKLMHACYNLRPNCNFAYFADNYNVPYGNRSKEDISASVDSVFKRIALMSPSAAVVACNTVTAECIEFLREKYTFPIVGIQPAVKPAAKIANKCIVLATPATVNSSRVIELVKKYGEEKTKLIACPDLAAYVENNIFNIKKSEVEELLPREECDGVVLGCTHYTFVSGVISAFYNSPVFDGVEGTANQICKILGKSNHLDFCTREVAFYGGNYLKNAEIFELLKNNHKFC